MKKLMMTLSRFSAIVRRMQSRYRLAIKSDFNEKDFVQRPNVLVAG